MSHQLNIRKALLSSISIAAVAAVALSGVDAAAQGKGSGQGQGQSMQGGGHGGAGGSASKRGGGSGQGSLRGLFRDLTGADTPGGEEEDSDRPDWAGTPGGGSTHGGGKPSIAGSQRGDLFGDLWVILRDPNGVPILSDDGFVQPIDADGNLIPLDAEGAPIDATLVQEVELGRLNVGRAPTQVLDQRADEVISMLEDASEITTDAAGRLVLTIDGVQSTIDSPLENLAIYVALMTSGSIPGLTPEDVAGTDFDFLVDGTYDSRDMTAAASFLAAATDKSSPFTADEIAYIDAFLGINTQTVGDVSYSAIDYSDFSYDRSDVYDGKTVTVLVPNPDGTTYSVQDVDVYDAVFGGQDVTISGTLDAYTQAADDARAVVNYVHEYAVPAPTTN